jgi:hypothetical protein
MDGYQEREPGCLANEGACPFVVEMDALGISCGGVICIAESPEETLEDDGSKVELKVMGQVQYLCGADVRRNQGLSHIMYGIGLTKRRAVETDDLDSAIKQYISINGIDEETRTVVALRINGQGQQENRFFRVSENEGLFEE